jgi:hypothetical protein
MATQTFTDLANTLTAAQSDVVVRLANVTTAATAVAALSTNVSGGETAHERALRLETLLNVTLGHLESNASVLQGIVRDCRNQTARQLFEIKGSV